MHLSGTLSKCSLWPGETLNLAFSIYYQKGWDWEAVKPYVQTAVNGYFKDLAKAWADQDETLIVRVSQLESRLLTIPGIVDVAQTKINGTAGNYPLLLDTIPILGTMTATTATIAGA